MRRICGISVTVRETFIYLEHYFFSEAYHASMHQTQNVTVCVCMRKLQIKLEILINPGFSFEIICLHNNVIEIILKNEGC